MPKGETLKFSFDNSKIFPGTAREYWVYIPAQYTPDKPACVYIGQDGIQLQAPTVFDNLIHKKEMPVTIGVFVMHGKVKAANADSALDRFNRSFEYDGLGDNYARFLLEELLPDVETKETSDGRPIRLSHSGNDLRSAGNPVEPSPPSPPPGNARLNSAACSVALAPMWAFAADTFTRPWLESMNRNRSGSLCRMVPTI